MTMLLRQSTSTTRRLGPFLDDTDGKTPETGLTISQSDIRLSKAGGAFAQSNDTGGGTHDENGWYSMTFNSTDTNTLGTLEVAVDMSGALPVWVHFMIIPANVYDSLIAGSDKLQVHADEITAGLITAAAIATAAIDADAIAADAIGASELASDAVTEIQSGLATASALATVDSNVDAILADTGTDGVVLADSAIAAAKVAASGANKIADHTIRRSFQNACDSSDGDTKSLRSLLGAIAKLINKIAISGTTLTIYEDDDTTALGTQTVTTDSGADPITALDTT